MKHLKLFLALILASAAGAQTPAGNPESGKRLFDRDGCYECHGYAGQGGRAGPRIAATSLSLQTLKRYIRRPAGAMPAYTEKVLPDPDLRDIYTYLKALPAAKPAKDILLLNQLHEQ